MREELMELKLDDYASELSVPQNVTMLVFFTTLDVLVADSLLLEDAFKFLLEDNSFILLESSVSSGMLASTSRELVLL